MHETRRKHHGDVTMVRDEGRDGDVTECDGDVTEYDGDVTGTCADGEQGGQDRAAGVALRPAVTPTRAPARARARGG